MFLRRALYAVISPLLKKRVKPCREAMLIHAFRKRESDSFLPLVTYFREESPKFKRAAQGRDFFSAGGFVHVCRDIYGYEVRICGGNMIDVAPSSYGINHEQARVLMQAILSNVEGSVSFEMRHNKDRPTHESLPGISWPIPIPPRVEDNA